MDEVEEGGVANTSARVLALEELDVVLQLLVVALITECRCEYHEIITFNALGWIGDAFVIVVVTN